MEPHKKLLLENKAWAEEKTASNPNYFKNLAKIQNPRFLWIGCADSRVPANQITNTEPGEVFVHRNIANLVVNTDINMLSVLQYAVEVLEVEDIIVCGHYNCGGINAAISNKDFGLINAWLKNIKDVYRYHEDEFEGVEDPIQRARLLTELTVKEQVYNLAKTTIVQKAWHSRKAPKLHGWVYGLDNGIIKELVNVEHDSPLDPIYVYNEIRESQLKDVIRGQS